MHGRPQKFFQVCAAKRSRRRKRREQDTAGVKWGKKWGGVIPLPTRLRGLEKRRSGGVRGGAPAENEFGAFLASQTSGGSTA